MEQPIYCYIVDDMEFNIEFVEKRVQALGLCVSGTATNPNIALKEIVNRESSVDILITDIDMPQMNGLELSKMIKAEMDIEVTFMSGERRETVAKMIEGDFDFFRKPCSTERFQEVLRPIIARIIEKRGHF